MINCCEYNNTKNTNNTNNTKKCIRNKDNKVFNLPRKFSKSNCDKNIKGFSMKSSCAPFKHCKKSNSKEKKEFLYNKKNPSKSRDIFSNDNPKDTVNVKYSNIKELKGSIIKLEKLFSNKEKNHKRISQIAMIMRVRINEISNKNKTYEKVRSKTYLNDLNKRVILIKKYTDFLKKRTKLKTFNERINIKFKI